MHIIADSNIHIHIKFPGLLEDAVIMRPGRRSPISTPGFPEFTSNNSNKTADACSWPRQHKGRCHPCPLEKETNGIKPFISRGAISKKECVFFLGGMSIIFKIPDCCIIFRGVMISMINPIRCSEPASLVPLPKTILTEKSLEGPGQANRTNFENAALSNAS